MTKEDFLSLKEDMFKNKEFLTRYLNYYYGAGECNDENFYEQIERIDYFINSYKEPCIHLKMSNSTYGILPYCPKCGEKL